MTLCYSQPSIVGREIGQCGRRGSWEEGEEREEVRRVDRWTKWFVHSRRGSVSSDSDVDLGRVSVEDSVGGEDGVVDESGKIVSLVGNNL